MNATGITLLLLAFSLAVLFSEMIENGKLVKSFLEFLCTGIDAALLLVRRIKVYFRSEYRLFNRRARNIPNRCGERRNNVYAYSRSTNLR